jgi:DNA-binding NtrC family response regulator
MIDECTQGCVEGCSQHPLDPILATSSLAQVLDLAAKVAAVPGVPVLVYGEPGTGAEELARYIHRTAAPPAGEMVVVRCRGVSRERTHAQLIAAAGRPRSPAAPPAATPAPASTQTPAPVAASAPTARTVFIEEVANLGVAAQGFLLTLLQSNRETMARQAGAEVIRVVASTAVDLHKMVGERTFLSDVLDQLAVVTIRLPALRERRQDIVPLAEQMIRTIARALQRPPPVFSPEAQNKLTQHSWPGNGYELRGVLERAMLVEAGDQLAASAIVLDESRDSMADAAGLFQAFSEVRSKRGRPATLDEIEQAYIVWLLEQTRGNRTAASRLLGISYPTMQKKIVDYRINFRAIASRRRREAG